MQKKKVPKLQLDKKAKKSLKVTVRQKRQKKKFAKLQLDKTGKKKSLQS